MREDELIQLVNSIVERKLRHFKGRKGDRGHQGEQGIRGYPGLQGFQGTTGPEGPEGPQGDTGASGTNGTDGADGATGATGSVASSFAVFEGASGGTDGEGVSGGLTGSNNFLFNSQQYGSLSGITFNGTDTFNLPVGDYAVTLSFQYTYGVTGTNVFAQSETLEIFGNTYQFTASTYDSPDVFMTQTFVVSSSSATNFVINITPVSNYLVISNAILTIMTLN
jgi:hypothetical protein